jgi:hypothetical protein
LLQLQLCVFVAFSEHTSEHTSEHISEHTWKASELAQLGSPDMFRFGNVVLMLLGAAAAELHNITM